MTMNCALVSCCHRKSFDCVYIYIHIDIVSSTYIFYICCVAYYLCVMDLKSAFQSFCSFLIFEI